MRNQISIRENIVSDEEYINEICKGVFNSKDYLPKIWKNWIKDKNGKFFVAVWEKKPIGTYHLYFEYKQVWMEALRVKKEFRKKGIGGILLEDAINRAQKYQNIKLLTDSNNKAALKLFDEYNFSSLSHQTMYKFNYTTNGINASTEIKEISANEIESILKKAYYNSYSKLIPTWWRFWSSNDEIIKQISRRALGYSIKRGFEKCQAIFLNTTEYDFRKTLHLIYFNHNELINEIIEKIAKQYHEYSIFTFQEKDHSNEYLLKENGFDNILDIVILGKEV